MAIHFDPNSAPQIFWKYILLVTVEASPDDPCSDGNGRTGRVVMIYSLLENNSASLIIKKKKKIRICKFLVKRK